MSSDFLLKMKYFTFKILTFKLFLSLRTFGNTSLAHIFQLRISVVRFCSTSIGWGFFLELRR